MNNNCNLELNLIVKWAIRIVGILLGIKLLIVLLYLSTLLLAGGACFAIAFLVAMGVLPAIGLTALVVGTLALIYFTKGGK